MLYDKRWEKPEIKANPFSLESLTAWLERQPADGIYCYADTGHCLLAQYFMNAGFGPTIAVGAGNFCISSNEGQTWSADHYYPGAFDDIAVGKVRTFGAALDRARKALAVA